MLTAIIKWTAICGVAAIVVLTQSAVGQSPSDNCYLCDPELNATDVCEWNGFCFEPGTYIATSECTCGCFCDPTKGFLCKKAKGPLKEACELCASFPVPSCDDGEGSSVVFIDRFHCHYMIERCLFMSSTKLCPDGHPCSLCSFDSWCSLLHKKGIQGKLGISNACYLEDSEACMAEDQ